MTASAAAAKARGGEGFLAVVTPPARLARSALETEYEATAAAVGPARKRQPIAGRK
jgi:hypothetical protein